MKGLQVFTVAVVVLIVTIAGTSSTPSDSASDFDPANFPDPEVGLIRFGEKGRGATGDYYLSTFKANSNDARNYCASTRRQALVIKDHVRQNEIAGRYRTLWGNAAPDWIWLSAQKYSGVFEWGDFSVVQYNNYLPNYSSWNGNCLNMIGPNGFLTNTGTNQYTWMPADCALLGYFVCEDKN